MIRTDEVVADTSVYPLEAKWRRAILAAAGDDDFRDLAERFIRAHPQDFSRLPPGCAPRASLTPGEIALLVFRLKHAYCAPALDPEHAPRIERLVGFFEALSERMFEAPGINGSAVNWRKV